MRINKASGARRFVVGLSVGVFAAVLGTTISSASESTATTERTSSAPQISQIHPRPRVLDATVTAVGSRSFTVNKTSVPIYVESSTSFDESGIAGASFADLAVGDHVRIIGKPSESARFIEARRVSILQVRRASFDATVKGLGVGKFTVLRNNATLTVNVNNSTTFSVLGINASFSDLLVGEHVHISARQTASAGVVTALQVSILAFPTTTFGATVTAMASGSFSAVRDRTPITVDLNSATVFNEAGLASVSLANLAVGDRVTVNAKTTASAGTFDALQVSILPFPVVSFDATVTAVGSGSFTAAKFGSSVTVNVTNATHFSEARLASVSFVNLAVGERVAVIAKSTAKAATFSASHVSILLAS